MNPEKIQAHHEVECRVSEMPRVALAATQELINRHDEALAYEDILLFTVAIRIEAKEKPK